MSAFKILHSSLSRCDFHFAKGTVGGGGGDECTVGEGTASRS